MKIEPKSLKLEPLWEVSKDEKEVKVLCVFKRKDGALFERYLPVEKVKFHWETVVDPATLEPIGTGLVIDEGYITLHDLQEKYFAKGKPPLVYKEESCFEVRDI